MQLPTPYSNQTRRCYTKPEKINVKVKFPFSFIVLNIFVSFTEKNSLQHYTFDDEIQL